MKAVWDMALPLSYMLEWRGGYAYAMTTAGNRTTPDQKEETFYEWKGFEKTGAIFKALAEIPWSDDFLKRDTIDLARMTLDRAIVHGLSLLRRDFKRDAAGRLLQHFQRDGAVLPPCREGVVGQQRQRLSEQRDEEVVVAHRQLERHLRCGHAVVLGGPPGAGGAAARGDLHVATAGELVEVVASDVRVEGELLGDGE